VRGKSESDVLLALWHHGYGQARGEIAPEPTGHGLPLSKCEAYNRSMTNAADRVEIITSVQRRRRWTASEKVRMVEQKGTAAGRRIARCHTEGLATKLVTNPHTQ
jgi:hypothetical protein